MLCAWCTRVYLCECLVLCSLWPLFEGQRTTSALNCQSLPCFVFKRGSLFSFQPLLTPDQLACELLGFSFVPSPILLKQYWNYKQEKSLTFFVLFCFWHGFWVFKLTVIQQAFFPLSHLFIVAFSYINAIYFVCL